MKVVLLVCAVLFGQMKTLQDRPAIRLPQHQGFIPAEYGGDLVELRDAPPTVQLPQRSPTLDSHGHPWAIDIRNFGPGAVTIVGRAQFRLQIPKDQLVHIKSTSTGYATGR